MPIFTIMSLEEFAALSPDDQQDHLWFYGSVLANRYEEAHIFLLYALDSFFVELQYDAYQSRLLRVDAFQSPDALVPYLPLLPDDLLAAL